MFRKYRCPGGLALFLLDQTIGEIAVLRMIGQR